MNKPDIFHWREQLQQAYMIGHVIDEVMGTHLTAQDPEVKKLINTASKAMAELYMLCGAREEE